MPPVDVKAVLSSLKVFQRRSVDHVFDRLYGSSPTRRFLLADEAGLGKTLVARGVIAKAIEYLREAGEKRIDVVYICSNADIARQNITRLNVTGRPDFQLASRITLLPQTVRNLRKNPLNFVSFTPGTSFNLGHSTGQGQERWLLYWFMKWTWPKLCQGAAAINVMQVGLSRERFRRWIADEDPDLLDRDLAERFKQRVHGEDLALAELGKGTYQGRLKELCQRFGRSREVIPPLDRQMRNDFIGDLRALLAATCIDSLQPDLIILDEFQRFKDLLRTDNPAGALAKHLFAWGEARVLLLSATPYKMYTLNHETPTDDHYKDFLETLRFLFADDISTERLTRTLAAYGTCAARIVQDGVVPLRVAKGELESELRRVMCRTEKLAVTEDRSGMLHDTSGPPLALTPGHIRGYLEIRRITATLGQADVLEYWKASPYLLNLMDADTYRVKFLLQEAVDRGAGEGLVEALCQSPESLLSPSAWQAYRKIDSRHALLERLSDQTVGAGWWRLLWIPPSFPYYELAGPFADLDPFAVTKRLVFSSWHVVPRAVSALLSYEAERRMMKGFDSKAVNTVTARDRRRPLLVFPRSEGRPAGMPVFALLYPSVTLARLGDPRSSSRSTGAARLPALEQVLTTASERLKPLLAKLLERAPTSGPEDPSWYWAAPILLDRKHNRTETERWFANPAELAGAWSRDTEEGSGWQDHVKEARDVALGKFVPSGKPPRDLLEVLSLMAVAGPANCALRSLAQTLIAPNLLTDAKIRRAAGQIAWGFRSLFNSLEVTALLRGINAEEPYWRRVLEYAANGCLQSVLDEYVHILVDLERHGDRTPHEAARLLAETIKSCASLHAQTPGLDWIKARVPGTVSIDNRRVRARFAMRFGDEHGDDVVGGIRKDAVRAAFNSPFWPFVLATTSVGQEGLDFHPYCHAVMHWNLPSNPVDMEQREGRVHRYKGHAVRKNVARLARVDGFDPAGDGNPWESIFRYAAERPGQESEISPYWVFPIEGGAVIERHAPTLPLSREAARLPALRGSLAVYRMVFGQPLQEDLVEHLKRTVPEEALARLSRELSVNLEPPQPLVSAVSLAERRKDAGSPPSPAVS